MSNNTFATGQLLRTAVLLLAVLISSTASAQTRPSRTDLGSKAESILWIGNSFFYYNNGMHNHFGQLVRAAGGRSRSTLVTISGAGLDWQNIDSLLRPDGLGRYSFEAYPAWSRPISCQSGAGICLTALLSPRT